MDDDELECEEEYEPLSIRWSWIGALVHLLDLVATILRGLTTFVHDINLMVAYHHNHVFDQRTFADETRVEIESLPATEE